jgi:drug/metabolite transporter (DMT)-like permease
MNNLWVYYALAACVMTALTVVLLNIISKSNYDNNLCLCYGFILLGLLSIIYILFNKNSNNILLNSITNDIVFVIILLSFLLFFKAIIIQKALKNTPNMAYAHIIINMNIILTLLASYFVFKEKFNIQTFIGMLMAIFSVSIVIFYSNA